MMVRLAQWTLDVQDVDLTARFWSEPLGCRVDKGDYGCAKRYPPDDVAPEVPTVWQSSHD